MAAATNGNTAVAGIDDILAALNEVAEVREARGAVRVRENNVGTAHVAEAVCHSAAFATVLGKFDNTQDVVQLVLAAELEGDVDCAVLAAIVDNENLIARNALLLDLGTFLCGFPKHLTMGLGRRAAKTTSLFVFVVSGTAEAFVEILNGFFEGGHYALLFIVCGNHDRNFDFGGLDVASVVDVEGIVAGRSRLAQLALGEPTVVPAGEGLSLADTAAGFGC